MAFLHIYLKYTQPLFVQALMGLKSLYEAKTVKIHLLGRPADGDLKRPFKGAGGMFGGTRLYRRVLLSVALILSFSLAAADPQTDKAAIEEAEKRIGGKKEE